MADDVTIVADGQYTDPCRMLTTIVTSSLTCNVTDDAQYTDPVRHADQRSDAAPLIFGPLGGSAATWTAGAWCPTT